MTRKVVRAADLKPPCPISDEDFAAICRTSSIKPDERTAVREFLDEGVATFAAQIRRDVELPGRKDDRRAIERAIADLRRAQYWVKRRAGPAGAAGLRVAGRRIAPVISEWWIRRHFSGDPGVPQPPNLDLLHGRPRWRTAYIRTAHIRQAAGPEVELPLADRIAFMERRSGAAIAALLDDIAAALDDGRRAIVQLPDGRRPLQRRAYLLAALAELWRRLGRRPTTGDTSKFGDFAEAVIEAIGWPTEGVNAALPEAIALSRRLYRGQTVSRNRLY